MSVQTAMSRHGVPMYKASQYATMTVAVEHSDGRVEFRNWRGRSAKRIRAAAKTAYPNARLRFGRILYHTRENPIASANPTLRPGERLIVDCGHPIGRENPICRDSDSADYGYGYPNYGYTNASFGPLYGNAIVGRGYSSY